MSFEEINIETGNLCHYGVLSKKEVFKWCINVSAITNPDNLNKRSDFFTFGPTKNARFYFMLPSTSSRLPQFRVYLCREWTRPNDKDRPKLDMIKVSLALLDLRDRLHHTCERVLQQDCAHVCASFDRSCYDKHHLTFLRNGFFIIYCALDVNEVIQEDAVLEDNLQQLSLVDDTSSVDLISDFSTLLENGVHSDVILTVGDASFKVHRAILSARSPVFAAMFEHPTLEKEKNQVVVTDVSSEAMSELLHYLYTGQTKMLSIQTALSLYVASDKYDLPKLKQNCSKLLCSKLTKDMLLNILVVANMHEDEALKEVAIQGLLDNAVEVMKSAEWLQLLKEYPEVANDIIVKLAIKSSKNC